MGCYGGTAIAYPQCVAPDVVKTVQILETERLLPFERVDNGDFGQDDQIDAAEIRAIRHPFLVTALDRQSYLLLSDSPLFLALVEEQVPAVPVQICPADELSVRAENLALFGFHHTDLQHLCLSHSELFSLDEQTRLVHEAESIKGIIEFPAHKPVTLLMRNASRSGCPSSLEMLMRAIGRNGRYLPLSGLESESELLASPAKADAHLRIEAPDLETLAAAARSERLFPPRLIRADSRDRVLSIDYPLHVLKSDMALSHKRSFLYELISLRAQACKTSYYQGRVYLLNH